MSLIKENLLQLFRAIHTSWLPLSKPVGYKKRRVHNNSIEENFGSLSFPWDVFCDYKRSLLTPRQQFLLSYVK